MLDVGCVIHLHSRYSDGTGTVPEIARAAARADADVVLLTDHDTMEARKRGEEGWHGGVLVGVGEEISPPGGNHFLAFGLDEPIDHRGLDAEEIVDAVHRAGGFGFAAHPFSRGNHRLGRAGAPMPWRALACLDGLELWSLVTDTVERVHGVGDVVRFLADPDRATDHPPRANVEAWDRLLANGGRVVAIGGLDAHQLGLRLRDRVPVRLMGYQRAFRLLRTRALLDGDAQPDLDRVYRALRAGRCYLARDSLAPARGFWFGTADRLPMGEEEAHDERRPQELVARLPRPAAVALRRDGVTVASSWTDELRHVADLPGVYRLEALLPHAGRMRTWILSNPVYLR